jgi:hypothetical protein
MVPKRTGPGIAKVRHAGLVSTRALTLVRATDPTWAQLFDEADVVSEGVAGQEGGRLVYRGFTSIVLVRERERHDAAWDVAAAARLAALDPHFRVRAMRVARREAQARAPGALEVAHMDVLVRQGPRGITVEVDVEGEVAASSQNVKL